MWMWYVAAVVAAAITAAIYEVRRILAPLVPVKGETNIPGIIGGITLPLLGDCWRFVGKDMMGVWDALDSIHKKQKVVHAWRGGSLTIVVGEPDMIETVLNSPKTKSKPDDFYGEFNMIADGAFSSNGKRWQTLRVALDKLTHPNYIMANYLWKLEESAKKLCATLDTKCDKGTFELNAIMLDQFVEIIAETVLGIPLNRFKDPKRFREKVATTANKALEVAVSGVLKPYVKIPIIHHFTRYKKLINELQEIIATTGPECFEIRSRILKERGDNVEDPNFIPECYADVVIQQAHIEKTDLRRVWPMFVEMITVSFDTPANVLSSTCLFLAMHPECQKKVYQEQLSIMGKSLEPPTMAEVSEMKYLEMCFKEALRHVAPPGFGRLVESEMKIDDYIFPEGAIVYVSTYTSRKDPTYWAKPMEYHPEHFLPEEVEKRPKGVYLPFSAGSRVCPGKSFAKLANLIILSTLMRRYKFSTHLKFQNIKYKYVVTLEPDTDYLLSITRRGEVNN